MDQRPIDSHQVQPPEVEQNADPKTSEQGSEPSTRSEDYKEIENSIDVLSGEYVPRAPYQEEVVQYRTERRNSLQALPMGAGKTRGDLDSVNAFNPEGCTLIVCKGCGLGTQRKEIKKWLGRDKKVKIVSKLDKQSRKYIWDHREDYDFLIITWEGLRNDIQNGQLPLYWPLIIGDEAQKLKNRKTALFKAFKKLKFDHLFFTSSKPAKKGPMDLWTLLYLMNRKLFPSYWRFYNTFCETVDGQFGKEYLGPKNVERLREILSDYMIRFTKDDVDKYLPKKNRIPHMIQLSPYQRKRYEELYSDMFTMVEGTPVVAPTILAKIVRLRQLCCCPKLLDPNAPDGSALDNIVELITGDESPQHITIFTPFAKALPFIEARLRKEGFEHVYILRGVCLQMILIDSENYLPPIDMNVVLCSALSYSPNPLTWRLVIVHS